jgi:hypothetical protein
MQERIYVLHGENKFYKEITSYNASLTTPEGASGAFLKQLEHQRVLPGVVHRCPAIVGETVRGRAVFQEHASNADMAAVGSNMQRRPVLKCTLKKARKEKK